MNKYWRTARGWSLAILVVGAARLWLTLSGFPDHQARYASMTAVMVIAAAYFPLWAARHGGTYRDLLALCYFLTVPYMLVEVVGLSVAGITGRPNIFHAPEYSLGTPLWLHLSGHIVGGLTWEPLFIWLISSLLLWLTWKIRKAESGQRKAVGGKR